MSFINGEDDIEILNSTPISISNIISSYNEVKINNMTEEEINNLFKRNFFYVDYKSLTKKIL